MPVEDADLAALVRHALAQQATVLERRAQHAAAAEGAETGEDTEPVPVLQTAGLVLRALAAVAETVEQRLKNT